MIRREFHQRPCACSICRPNEYAGVYSFGVLTPMDKTWNAWRWLFYVGKKGIWYLRWNGFWQAQPNWRKVDGSSPGGSRQKEEDDVTRSAEPGVYPTAVHAANNEKD